MHVNNEGTNLELMQQHAMKRPPLKDTLVHEKRELLDPALLDATSTVLNGVETDIFGRIDSDSDAQLLIRLVFKQRVTVDSVAFICDSNPEARPKEVRFFANRPSIDFGDVEHSEAAKIADMEIFGNRVVLAGTKFSRITSLEIFVVSNIGDFPQTIIDKLEISGSIADHYH
jgi:hypothetical protein